MSGALFEGSVNLWLRRCVLPARSQVYEARLRTVSPRNILSLLRSCLGPQTANWAILAGVFDITITFHHLLSPLRFLLMFASLYRANI